MKDIQPLEWRDLPRYEAASLFDSMRHSAQEHGYKSFLWFGLVRLKDHWFNNWSMRAPWGGVRKWLQRKRGVKIGKNVHWGTHVVVDYPYPNYVVYTQKACKFFIASCGIIAPQIVNHLLAPEYSSCVMIVCNKALHPFVEERPRGFCGIGFLVSCSPPSPSIINLFYTCQTKSHFFLFLYR